jgi:hypothetical protein
MSTAFSPTGSATVFYVTFTAGLTHEILYLTGTVGLSYTGVVSNYWIVILFL